MRSNINKEAAKIVAERYKLPLVVVEKVIEAVYTDLKMTIEDDTNNGYRIAGLGSFVKTEGNLKRIEITKIKRRDAYNKRKLQGENTQSESSVKGV